MNLTAQNETKVIDDKELARNIAEVESMLRDMRFRGFNFQKKLAENELDQANKCKWQDWASLKEISGFFILFCNSMSCM